MHDPTPAMYIVVCPTCNRRCEYQRAEDAAYRPFCCLRCKQIDLGKWLNEEYRISEPVRPEDPPEESPHGFDDAD